MTAVWFARRHGVLAGRRQGRHPAHVGLLRLLLREPAVLEFGPDGAPNKGIGRKLDVKSG